MQHKRLSTDTSSVSARRETDAKHVYSASGPTNVCSNTETDTCLLQVQKVKTKRETVNVMWDNAASLCFVTNSTAKEQNLKGKRKTSVRTSFHFLLSGLALTDFLTGLIVQPFF